MGDFKPIAAEVMSIRRLVGAFHRIALRSAPSSVGLLAVGHLLRPHSRILPTEIDDPFEDTRYGLVVFC